MSKIAITVDIETDWGGRLKPSKNNMKGINEGLEIILELFQEYDIYSTFFISTETMKEAKEELLNIKKFGHEVASHGHNHSDYSQLSVKQFEYQVKKSVSFLEEQFNQKVYGFRSPQFRLNSKHFRVLYDEGLIYDSSIVPTNSIFGRYNNKGGKIYPYFDQHILEIPVSFYPILNIPLGLLWVNLFGMSIIKMQTTQTKLVVLYLHLFDLLNNKKYDSRFDYKVNFGYLFKQNTVFKTLENILKYYTDMNYRFNKMCDLAFFYK